jgi:hypothetical protein
MKYTKKQKTLSILAQRFSISFFRMKDELVTNVHVFLYLSTNIPFFNLFTLDKKHNYSKKGYERVRFTR